MKTKASERAFKEGRGYVKADWESVSDNPVLTPERAATFIPLAEALPLSAAALQRATGKRGRPPVENPKAAVTLRLDPGTVEKFKAAGKDWRKAMAQVLERHR